ncbi:MAG: sugar phosphate isomerase/epimerase, partial [Anaerolineales bacterium]
MKKGIRKPVFFPKTWSLEQCFATASAKGFQGMELIFRSGYGQVNSTTRSTLAGDPEGYRSWQSLEASITYAITESQCAELATLAAGYGMTINGLASGYSTIDKPNSPIFQSTVEYITKAIERTRWLGGVSVLVSFEKVSHTVPDRTARQWVGELLKRLSPIAAAYAVSIAYELVWPAIYETPGELVEVLETANHAHVGIYFDPANVLQHIDEKGQDYKTTPKPEDWLRLLLPHIRSVHMKDYAMATGFCDLLTGDVNWQAIRSLLWDGRY